MSGRRWAAAAYGVTMREWHVLTSTDARNVTAQGAKAATGTRIALGEFERRQAA
ncbi:hypothetical protein [Actinoplanes sp. NPDC048796]|uniref:hypothetical protein n=1 Tax=Actinoplanes sp. NPDC048796 TaxID=3155640 RepID=UPI0033CD908E